MVRATKIVQARRFQGEPKLTDFEFIEEDVPELQDGEFLCKAEYISVDPYQRVYMSRYPLGTTMLGYQVAKIIESRDPNFPVGRTVTGQFGWRTYTIGKAGEIQQPTLLPDLGNLPSSYGIGILGRPGNAAYFGFLELCSPKEGETVVVTAAAGAVGCIVGQIAKIKGCHVIGFAGTDEKCESLKTEYGFDYAFNYKKVNANEALQEAAPNGVDCYFDNVGGELSYTIMLQMNYRGRISVCGSISTYNFETKDITLVPAIQPLLIGKELKMEGFIVQRWKSKWPEGIKQNLQWIEEGKLKIPETITEGFENMPKAFIEMLHGSNFGKALVKIEQ